jgi:LysM repeat protein
MNTSSPLVPQGSFLEQKSTGRSRVKVAFFCVVGVHVAAIMAALLAQGCRREETPPPDTTQVPILSDADLLPVDTNPPPPLVETPPPPPVDPTPVAPPPIATEYTIARGDSFSTIAKKFPGVTARAIQEANPGVDPLRLQIGQKIVIPPPTAPPANGATAGPTVSETGEVIYTVKSGDNLTKIASQFGTTVRALRSANNLVTDNIKVGQKLKIPGTSAPPEAVPGPAPQP